MSKIGLIFAFLTMFSWGIGDFLIQRTVKKIGDIETTALIGLVGATGLFPFVIKDLHLIFASWQNMVILLLLSLILIITNLLLFESYKKGKLSVIEIIVTAELPLTILFGVYFLKDTLSLLQIFFIILIFIGVILSSVDFRKINKKHFLEKGVILAFGVAIFSSGVNSLTAVSSQRITPILAIWVPWTVNILFSYLYILKERSIKDLRKDLWKNKKLAIPTGIIDTLAWVFFALAVSTQELSITAAITESYAAVAVFLGLKLNKEKISGFQIAGAVIALSGSFIIALI